MKHTKKCARYNGPQLNNRNKKKKTRNSFVKFKLNAKCSTRKETLENHPNTSSYTV